MGCAVTNNGVVGLLVGADRGSGCSLCCLADEDSLHVHLADEAVCIGHPPSAESYLNMSNIISAALGKGCDAIHPVSATAALAPLHSALPLPLHCVHRKGGPLWHWPAHDEAGGELQLWTLLVW